MNKMSLFYEIEGSRMKPTLIDPSTIARIKIDETETVFKDIWDRRQGSGPQSVPTCRLYLKGNDLVGAAPYVLVAGNLEEIYHAMTGATLGYVGSIVPKYQPLKLNP